jgi:undecaprenyl-diphosphatase
MHGINPFDLSIIRFVQTFSQDDPVLDALVAEIARNSLLHGGVIMATFWWLWARSDDRQQERRESLVFALFASILAIFLARALALSLPFRARPMNNPLIAFQFPYSADPTTMIGWSSFPSDHAVLFFCFAACLWTISKRLGLLAFCHALFVVCLPLIYFGNHYPTDIVAGALLGMGVAFLSKIVPLRRIITRPALRWLDTHPASANAFLFLCSFEIAELFDSLRHIALSSYHSAEIALQTLR